jgi:hypothetical protein
MGVELMIKEAFELYDDAAFIVKNRYVNEETALIMLAMTLMKTNEQLKAIACQLTINNTPHWGFNPDPLPKWPDPVAYGNSNNVNGVPD